MQTLLLTCLLAVPAIVCLRSFDMSDADVWWHLRTGEWIAAHHAIPHFEPFSRVAAGAPWVAYSWASELLLYKLFHLVGNTGLAIYTSAMVVLITTALFWMIDRQGPTLSMSAVLTFVCMYSMGHLYTPRPWQFTILLFLCELGVLMDARRTGSRRHLIWLPLIFGIWANVHIQFIDGLIVLGLAVAEAMSARWWSGAQKMLPFKTLIFAFAASIVATLANPYGWRVYAVARELATQSGAFDKITELQAIPFRDPAAYVVLLLAFSSAAMLGWQRRILSFEGALLAFAAVLSFRSQRDVWVMAIVAAAIIAPWLPTARTRLERPSPRVMAAGFAFSILVTTAAFRMLGINSDNLQARLALQMPVAAAEYIRQSGFQGPLFNDFNWGGFLIWKLRMPVTLDGRANVYGDQRMDRSVVTWSGQPDWASDPDLISARLIVGPVDTPLIQLLRRDGRFRLAYEDKLAAVFIADR